MESGAADGAAGAEPAVTPVNEVRLVGRLASVAELRTLPSGDELVVFRLLVGRPPGATRTRAGRRRPSSDTLDCVATTAALRRKVLGWRPGDDLAVEGALRRRFWRGEHGVASRCEVEVSAARRVRRAA